MDAMHAEAAPPKRQNAYTVLRRSAGGYSQKCTVARGAHILARLQRPQNTIDSTGLIIAVILGDLRQEK